MDMSKGGGAVGESGGAGGEGQREKSWDNRNSIINKKVGNMS